MITAHWIYAAQQLSILGTGNFGSAKFKLLLDSTKTAQD